MTTGSASSAIEIDGPGASASTEADEFAADWRAMRSNEDIQFAPVEYTPEPRDLDWLERLSEWLSDVFGGFFGFLDALGPLLKWGLITVAICLVLFILYRLIEPYLMPRRKTAGASEATMGWYPDAQASSALLEDADRLAAEGKFDEATHLLLQRSVSHLSQARPDWVEPSSTSRELAEIEALPQKARATFRVIAERVERSLFAMRALGREDWEVARAAYADFAETSLDGTAI